MVFLTKLKPEPMGAHSLSAAYGVNSLVMSDDGAAAYISVKDVPAGTPLTDTDYWRPHTDLTAVVQKANAARDEMLEIARNLTDTVEKSGNPVQAELVGGLPFDRVATALEPIQAGSGDPSPTNIRPISGWTGAAIKRRGKNLLNYGAFTKVGTINGSAVWENNGVTLTATSDDCYTRDWFAGDYPNDAKIYVTPGETYTLSWEADKTYDANVFIFPNNMDHAVMCNNRDQQSLTYTAQDGDSYFSVRFTAKNAGDTISYRNIMVNIGASAGHFEPYQDGTYAADFGQTVYGGTMDWLTGVLTVDRAVRAFDGTEVWGYTGTEETFPRFGTFALGGNVAPDIAGNPSRYASSHFKSVGSLGEAKQNGNGLYIYDGGYIDIICLSITSLDDWKSYLAAQYAAGTPVQVAYKMATSTTIQLTPREIRQLQGMNTLYGDGSISITGRANPAIALEARIAALEAAALAE